MNRASTTAPKPRLPRGGEVGKDALTDLRRFHYDLPVEGDAPRLPSGLLPALLHPYRETPVRGEYPVFVPPLDGGADALPLSFGDLLDRAMPDGDAARILRDNRRRLERQVRRLLDGEGRPMEARDLLSRAGDELRSDLGLPTDDDARLGESLGTLISGVPAGGQLVPWGSGAPFPLLRHAARARLQPARTAVLEEARQRAAGLAAMLGSGREREGGGSAGGALGSRFVDPKRLAGLTGASRDAARLAPERRERLEGAKAALDRFIAGGTAPGLSLILPEDRDAVALAVPEDDDAWEVTTAADPFAAAAERFDAAAEELAGVLRALRVARLEMAGDYSPERHDPVLERLDWHAFGDDERALLAPVVAVAPADHAAGDGLASLTQLLLSGRPVQVLVETDPAASPGEGPAASPGYRFEPASLGVGLREAFVQQSSLARPVHLAAGLARALSSGRASLHVLDTPPAAADRAVDSVEPWLVAGAALEGRAHPLFLYDPEAGKGWARRLDFSRNPEPARDWPGGRLEAAKEGGGDEALDLAFTFADYALLAPAWRDALRPVPPGLEHEDLVPLAGWLDLGRDEAAHKVPWIWAVDGQGTLHRLAVARRLARACRDRLDFWHTLQEMAGVRSEYADRAAETAREEAEGAARQEIARLSEEHARELERIRRAAAEEVVDRLTAALLEVDVTGLPRPAGAPGFRLGGSVDEVTANLLAAVGDLEGGDGGETAPSPQVEELTSRLLSMLDRDSLEA